MKRSLYWCFKKTCMNKKILKKNDIIFDIRNNYRIYTGELLEYYSKV